MANTTVSDLANVINTQFLDALYLQNTANNALVQSGLMVTDPRFVAALRGQGSTIKVDRLNDLSGDEEVITEGTDSTPGAVGCTTETAVRLIRSKSFGATLLAEALSAKDPVRFIMDRISAYQVGQTEKTLISALKGIAGVSAFAALCVNDISALTGTKAIINHDAILDTKQLVGDAKGKFVAIAMHSATHNYLSKKNLIDTVRPSDDVEFQAYGNLRVIVDDSLPVATGVYSTFLFANGAVAYGEADPAVYNPELFAVEPYRNVLGSASSIMTRRNYLVHPYGFKYKGTITAGTGGPTNAALATASNWDAQYSNAKHYGITVLKHKIA